MALTAQSIVQRAAQLVLDATGTRWPASELVQWLNDGQREIVLQRPDANTIAATGTMAVGTRQNLKTMTGISSSNPAKLIEVVRNMAASGAKKAVTLCAREILDRQRPSWHADTGSIDIVHYTFDARDPTAFYVWPPALITAQLEIIFSAYPTDISAPSGADYTTVSGNISLPDIYGNALLDYVLYRAYLKDSEYAGNPQRSANHYAAFANSLGIEVKATVANGPSANVTYNPNNPGMKTGLGGASASAVAGSK